MISARIGHTSLTWNVLANPTRLVDAVRDCAELGFAGTETGGFVYDWWERERPRQLRELHRDHNVVMTCLFQFGDWIDPEAADGLLNDGGRWATAVQELGGRMLMLVPGSRRDDPPYNLDDFKRMAETMNRVGQVAHDAGADATMHPHWGTMAESPLEIDVLLDNLDPSLVGFAPDTGQIAKGGADPIAAIERWADRVRYVHLKDLSPQWDEQRRQGVPLRSPEGYAELGQGVIDLQKLLPILDRINYAGWLMAELDEAKRPPREAAALSRNYLRDVLGQPVGNGN
jgi:inosose dehydratase